MGSAAAGSCARPATCIGASNRDLEAAALDAGFRTDRDAPEARRSGVIRRLGKAARVIASHDLDPPHEVVEIDPTKHINGVGLVYFAEIHDMIAGAERRAVPDLVKVWPLQDRRVHYFGNLDADDRLEITSRASAQALSPDACVVVKTHAKRASDGVVIATAESIFAP